MLFISAYWVMLKSIRNFEKRNGEKQAALPFLPFQEYGRGTCFGRISDPGKEDISLYQFGTYSIFDIYTIIQ